MARVLVLLLALLALASPPTALAQGDAFSPLPPARPEATVEPQEPSRDLAGDSSVTREVLFGVAGLLLVAFVVIGTYISRDARRHLTEGDRRALEREERRGEPGVPGERRPKPDDVKRKARSKGKAQRQARKAQRRR